MNILNTIKQAITNTGASALRTISSINPQLGGKVGSAVNTIGKALNNPFPEAYATEQAQSAGGQAQREAIQNNSSLTQAQKDAQLKALEQKAQSTAGFSSAVGNPGSTQIYQNNQGVYIDPEPGGFGSSANPDLSNDYKKRKYEEWLRTQQQQQEQQQPIGEGGVRNVASSYPELSGQDLQNLINKYAGQSRDNAQSLADEIERVATENANREYDAIKQSLGVQKGEVGTVGKEQRGRVTAQKDLSTKTLEEKQSTDISNIEKQKEGFLQESAKTADQLAQNWRDMSLQVQRIMRARGATDSSFSAGEETKVLLDFNKGLRTLASQSQSAVKDFADAVIQTNQFYSQSKAQLELDANNQLGDIDTWVRQQTQSIQSQENMALVQKLNAIRDAISKGQQLKIQVEQSIADKQFAIDSWIVQTNINFKNAVALAGQGKTADAQKTIEDYRNQAIKNNDLLLKGGYQLDTVQVDGKSTPVLHGYLPDGSVDTIYLTPQGAQQLQTNQQNYSLGKPDATTSLIQNASQTPTTNSGGGLLGTLKSIIGL